MKTTPAIFERAALVLGKVHRLRRPTGAGVGDQRGAEEIMGTLALRFPPSARRRPQRARERRTASER